jgi:cytochrome c-type biogenesis protein CcmH/NrfG
MTRDSVAFALSGVMFGLIVGWILGSQRTTTPAAVVSAPAAAPTPNAPAPPPRDAARVAELERQAQAEPANAGVRTSLGNLYFDAERFHDAIKWYEASLTLAPRDAEVSTDLAVAYYYTNQTDRALGQLDRSLELNATHLKALLNQGIIRAFGKQDLAGAAASWQRVVDLAPDSEEARRARQGLDGLRSAHAATQGGQQP